MLNRKIGVSGPQPKPSALNPAKCEAWIEVQSAINQGDGWIDVRLEIAEDLSGVAEDIGIVASSPKRAASKIDAILAVPLPILAPTVCSKHLVAMGCLRKSQSIVRVTLERLPEQIKCAHRSFPIPRLSVGTSSEVKVVRGEISCRPLD